MKEFKIPKRLAELDEILRYDSQLKEIGAAGHFSVSERILINQERGQLLSGKDNYCQPIALRAKIDFVITKINNLN